jgi:hypothetical protein
MTADLPHVTVRQADQRVQGCTTRETATMVIRRTARLAAMAVATVILATAVPLATPVTATLR